MPPNVVLDSSAILTVFKGESGTDMVLDIVRRARRQTVQLHTAFIAMMETEYVLLRTFGEPRARQAMAAARNWPLRITESDRDWSHEAAIIKSRGGLSLADAWIAALALRLDAELFHKDKEFDSVAGLRSIRL